MSASTLAGRKVCSRCIYDESLSGISFDESGVCNYCHQVDDLVRRFGTGHADGIAKLEEIIAEIKTSGRTRKYDCVVGVSGGTDSSYLLVKAVEWGLRPIAVHYDNTWNSAVATQNIAKITKSLGIDLFTYVVDNKEIDDIKRAFVLSGVAEFDTDTDLAFVQVIRTVAARYGVRYILEGHSFVEEGVSPVGNNYFDGAYIADIHSKFGRLSMKTYPLMTFFQYMKWIVVYRQKFIRPLWYLNYSKCAAKVELSEFHGWTNYGGHHLENRGSAFAHSIWIPQRYAIDYRILSLAARVRSGRLNREIALAEYKLGPTVDPELIHFVKKRLDLDDTQYSKAISAPRRSYKEFRTYKKRFERLRPLFYIFAKANLVPMSFYLKYCFPAKAIATQ